MINNDEVLVNLLKAIYEGNTEDNITLELNKVLKEDNMPQQAQNSMRGTSPSKNIQRGVDTAWAAQQNATTSPQKALADKATDNPVKVGK